MNGYEPTPNPSQEGNPLTAQVENFCSLTFIARIKYHLFILSSLTKLRC